MCIIIIIRTEIGRIIVHFRQPTLNYFQVIGTLVCHLFEVKFMTNSIGLAITMEATAEPADAIIMALPINLKTSTNVPELFPNVWFITSSWEALPHANELDIAKAHKFTRCWTPSVNLSLLAMGSTICHSNFFFAFIFTSFDSFPFDYTTLLMI